MRLASLSLAVTTGVLVACGSGSFQAVSQIASVRILATMADEPYAKPGDTVTLTTLAVDGRVAPPAPMKLYWLPTACFDPPRDAYYACFAALAGQTGKGGGSGGTGPALMPGVDLTPFLPEGPTFKVKIPADIVSRHEPVPGSPAPFGTAFAFNVACAGHVEILPVDPSNANPLAPPIGCFDASHNQLGPDDYVIGFAEIYAYDAVANQNPVIGSVTLQGMPVDATLGITFERCTGDCQENDVDVVVPDSSWEVNPGDVDPNGTAHHEVVWVDYFATGGSFGSNAKLLYDAVAGRLPDTHVTYTPPAGPGEQTMYVVVHDNRGGTAWQVIPLHVR